MQEDNININEIQDFIKVKNVDSSTLRAQQKELDDTIQSFAVNGNLNSPEYIELNKKNISLLQLAEVVNAIESDIQKHHQAYDLINDADFKDIAEIELKELEELLKQNFAKLQELTVLPLKNDDKKAILEFRPGVGGSEASLFAEDLLRMYTRYCNDNGLSVENITMDYDAGGGIKEAILIVNNEGSYGKLRFESGVHRVQRVPSTESLGRIHTSTASLVILPKVENKDINIKPEDLRIDVYRSSGPGGQSVNKTDSAVRVTHLPTGITVACQAGKSQHKNKDMAMSILLSKLTEIEDTKINSEVNQLRESSIKDGDRSSKIRTFNFAQSRVTDHRIGKSWFNLEEILNGNLGDIISTVSRELRK